jgi:OFA family oxalate/formate antiporter-like MFS transporter
MKRPLGKGRVLAACCAAIFWPGSFIFGFPGVMGPQWQQTFEVTRAAVGQTLFFMLAAVGFAMYPTGRWQGRFGTERLAAAGVILCGTSTILVGLAPNIKLVYLWAFVTGGASSFIYIPALTVIQRWYPERRGLVSGVVNLSFASSAALMSPVFTLLLKNLGSALTTLVLGLLALAAGLTAAPFIRPPQEPVPSAPKIEGEPREPQAPTRSLTVSESLHTKSFWFLWFSWAFVGAAGVAMVTLSVSYGLSKGHPIQSAVLILTAFNITNGLSRLISGYLSDIFGRNVTMSLAFWAAGFAYLLLPYVHGVSLWAILAAFVGFAFGTLFAVSAPLASDCFGMAHFGAIFGLVFTAYGFIAGALGPWLSGYLLDKTEGDFRIVFGYLGVCCFVSAVLIKFATPSRLQESSKLDPSSKLPI